MDRPVRITRRDRRALPHGGGRAEQIHAPGAPLRLQPPRDARATRRGCAPARCPRGPPKNRAAPRTAIDPPRPSAQILVATSASLADRRHRALDRAPLRPDRTWERSPSGARRRRRRSAPPEAVDSFRGGRSNTFHVPRPTTGTRRTVSPNGRSSTRPRSDQSSVEPLAAGTARAPRRCRRRSRAAGTARRRRRPSSPRLPPAGARTRRGSRPPRSPGYLSLEHAGGELDLPVSISRPVRSRSASRSASATFGFRDCGR